MLVLSPREGERRVVARFSLEELDAQMRRIVEYAEFLLEQQADTPEVIERLWCEFRALLRIASVVSPEE